MLKENFFTYHEKNHVEITAIEDCTVYIGTPPTKIKENNNGFNHNDLAKGSLLNFFSFPKQKQIFLKSKESIKIDSFVAYRIYGNCLRKFDNDEIIFFMS